MAKELVKKEIDAWLESDDIEEYQDAFIDLQEVKDDQAKFVIGENEIPFSISFSKQYPSEGNLLVFSEDATLSDWQEQVNQFVEKKKAKIGDLLSEAANLFLKLNGTEEEENELEDDDMGFNFKEEETPKPKKSKEEQEIDDKMERGEFLEIGSPQATLRLIRDLKSLRKSKPEDLGFEATPVTIDGMENLYHWHVKLLCLDKSSDLYKDLQKVKKKTGQDYILLEMRFSSDYPHVPPFIRVVRPRFAFRTGHVTIGGSICMQLLTKSGWSSSNDIESILIQISAELISGGGRLDPGMDNKYEYSETEAWDAFYRAARTHNWDTTGLSSQMFPKTGQKNHFHST